MQQWGYYQYMFGLVHKNTGIIISTVWNLLCPHDAKHCQALSTACQRKFYCVYYSWRTALLSKLPHQLEAQLGPRRCWQRGPGPGSALWHLFSSTNYVCICSCGTLKPTISAITEKLPHVNNMMWWDVKKRKIKVHTMRLKDKFSVFPVWSTTDEKKIFNLWLQMLVACRRKAKTDKKKSNSFQNICVCVRP